MYSESASYKVSSWGVKVRYEDDEEVLFGPGGSILLYAEKQDALKCMHNLLELGYPARIVPIRESEKMDFEELTSSVIGWAEAKNLIQNNNLTAEVRAALVARQFLKVGEEFGELSGALAKDDYDKSVDSVGDLIVTLIIVSAIAELPSLRICLQRAWDEIKNRTGRTENGVFIKDAE